ncbi:MAG: phage tail protein [Blastochloris viridis]|uniref:Phage tail protein n=1 Tax=Blastochloris viridis TaxID=1079 RepID=A0A6N4R9I9_BLAVI|nr:MAG: phage tail protein [Blastochloris viridis]
MTATVAILYNPFQPERNKQVFKVTSQPTLREWLAGRGIEEFPLPTICVVDGEPVLRADWNTCRILPGMVVAFVALPQGGGGGGKILSTVLMIAVMVAAPYAGAALAASMGMGAVGAAVMTAGVALVGSALVNILIPPPSPTMPSVNYGGSSPSPTYSLQAQGNQARLGEPIPVIYGRHVVYPDFASTPYAEYVGNDQFLFQLHTIGQGEYDLEQIRIEDTSITSFEEVIYEVIPPGGSVTLLEPDVVTAPEVAGQELLATADGGNWVGPFSANPAETKADQIAIDIEMPRGVYYANNDGSLANKTITWQVQARLIDDEGEPVGGWVTLADETFTANTNTAQRKTYKYTATAGRYEVRLFRTNVKDMSSRAAHEIRWVGLKARLVGSSIFEGATMLALKMRATDNLSQRSSRMINCIVTRKLPVWSPVGGWSALQPTRSIAWALADVLRATYGAKLADSRIDLQALYDLDQIWSVRGDTFNGVFDQKLTVWEALSRIARCGRAVPFLQGGIVRFVRDEPRTLPVVLFSPRNIAKGSFRIEYVMPGEDTADAVTVQFLSSRTWKQDEVTSALPESSAGQPATVALFGCTDKLQARREGLYMAAANRYRRRLVTFQTELEGMIPTYGDLIAVSHDMPRWGRAGEVIAWDEPVLTLSEPVVFEEAGPHYIALRKRDGGVSGPWEVLPGESVTQVVLQEEPDITPFTGASEERTHFAFGNGEDWAVLARVTGVKPRGDLVEISCVVENPLVHTADQT